MKDISWTQIVAKVVKMLRFNVLTLIFFGYGLIALIFLCSVLIGKHPDDSYEVLKEPIMTMIGGTLAIAKDLIPARRSGGGDSNTGSAN